MLKIALLDDSIASLPIFSGAIQGAFKAAGVDCQVVSFSRPESFVEGLTTEIYDPYFLDVNMPVYSGIQVAQKLRNQGCSSEIIFLSSDEQKVFECFSVTPFGFIRKDKFIADLTKIVDLYCQTNHEAIQQERIRKIKIKGEVVALDIFSVVYAEGNRNYQCLHLQDGTTMDLRLPMKELEAKLSADGFIRIQKGFLVNYRFIRKFGNDEVTLTNNTLLTLSRKLKESVMKQYLELTNKNEFLNF